MEGLGPALLSPSQGAVLLPHPEPLTSVFPPEFSPAHAVLGSTAWIGWEWSHNCSGAEFGMRG